MSGPRGCGGEEPAPARLIEGGIPTEALVENVMVSRFADHPPLYRQEQIMARHGVLLDRATLAFRVGSKQLMAPAREGPPVTLAFCWSHVRRGFYDPAKSGTSPIATEALVRLAALYRSETEIRGKDPAERLAQRQIDELIPWCRKL